MSQMPKLIIPIAALFLCSTPYLIKEPKQVKSRNHKQLVNFDFVGHVGSIERVVMSEGDCWGCQLR